jgi:hypothetical protein
MARVYINRHVIAANQKSGERTPPIVIAQKGRRTNASTVQLEGTAHIVYAADAPLSSGARVWIQCDEPHCRIVKP